MARFSNSRRSGAASGQRTAAEREQARREREEARLARDSAQEQTPEAQSAPAEPASQPAESTPPLGTESSVQATIDPASLRTEEHAVVEPDTDHHDQQPRPQAASRPAPQQPALPERRHRLLVQRSRRRSASA